MAKNTEKKQSAGTGLLSGTELTMDSKYAEIVKDCNGTLLHCYECRYKTLCFCIANSGTGSPYQYKHNTVMQEKTIGELLDREPAGILC